MQCLFFPVWLISLSIAPSRSIHAATNGKISYFLWLSNISLCVCVSIYIYIYICMCVCIYIYHIFFIHSSMDGHLGYFHSLAIVNSAALNIGIHISSKKAGSYGSSVIFSIVAASIYFPTSSAQVFPFLHILANTYCFLSFW